MESFLTLLNSFVVSNSALDTGTLAAIVEAVPDILFGAKLSLSINVLSIVPGMPFNFSFCFFLDLLLFLVFKLLELNASSKLQNPKLLILNYYIKKI